MESQSNLNIFEFFEYRSYLNEYYRYKKSLNRHFSHRQFALKAGIKSSGYFSEVLNGQRKLSKAQIPKFAQALNLTEKEKTFFELMVDFCHAKSPLAKQKIYSLMLKILPLQVQQVRLSQQEYFSKWYYVAIRESLSIAKIKGDGEELAALLDPPITVVQARNAIKLLERLKLIVRDKNGYWQVNHSSLLSSDDPAAAMQLRAFQAEMMLRAQEALERVPQPLRDISCVTMSVSDEGWQRIKTLSSEFHKQILQVVQSDKHEDRIIQLNLQLFPLTRIEDKNANDKI